MWDILAFLFIFFLVYWLFVAIKHPKNFPPGPRYLTLPVVGDSLVLGSNVISGLEQLTKKYGSTVGLWMGPFRTVVMADFNDIQAASAMEELSGRPKFEVAAAYRGGLVDGSFPGVLIASDKTWSEQRRFTLHNLRNLGFGKMAMEELVAEEVKELCQHLDKSAQSPMDVRNEFQISVLNGLWRILANKRFDPTDPKLKQLMQLMDQVLVENDNLLTQLAVLYKPIEIITSALNLVSGLKSIQAFVDFANEMVAEHVNTFQDDNMRDFIDHYLAKIAQDTGSGSNSSFRGQTGHINLANVIIDLFVAGSETTSSTLNWAILYMIMHPDIQRLVQQELDQVTGGSRMPTYEDRVNTPFTEAVIHEVQRLGNILPMAVVHEAVKDCQVGKYFIPKGTQVFFTIGAPMKDEKYFSNAKVFQPDRFIKDGKFTPNPRVIPFGTGKRRCLGETLAKMELYLFFTGLMTTFNVVQADESVQLTDDPKPGGTRSPKPYKVRFIPRR